MKFVILLSLIALAFTTEPTYSKTTDVDCSKTDFTATFAAADATGFVAVAECTADATDAEDTAECDYDLYYVDYVHSTTTYEWCTNVVSETDLAVATGTLSTCTAGTGSSCSVSGSVVTCPYTFDFSSTNTLHYSTDDGAALFNALTWTAITCTEGSSAAAYAMSLAASVFAF